MVLPGRSLEISIKTLFDAVAVAGRANHCAGTATETLVAPFLPYRRVEFDVEEAGQSRYLNFGFKAVLDVLAPFDQAAIVFISRLFDPELLEEVECFRGVDRKVVAVADVGAEKIESMVDGVPVHRMAEAVRQRQMVHANDESIFPACQIVGRRVGAMEHHIVKDVDRIDVAGSEPDKDDRWSLVPYLLFPVSVTEVEVGELVAVGQEKVLGRRVCHRVIKLDFVDRFYGHKLIDRFAVASGVYLSRSERAVILDKCINKSLELTF